MVAIAAVVDNTFARIRVTVTSATDPTVDIYRIGPDNTPVHVRNADPIEHIGGTAEVQDYEAELNVPVRYRVVDGATTVESSNVTLTQTQSWFKSPFFPAVNVKLSFVTAPVFTRSRPVGIHPVLGRSTPITVSGTLGSKTGTLEFLTGTTEATSSLEYFLENTSVGLLQVPTGRIGSVWVTLGDVTVSPVTRFLGDESHRWSVGVTQVDRPEGTLIGSPTSSYQALKDTQTYTTTKNSFTYLTLLRSVGPAILPPEPGGF